MFSWFDFGIYALLTLFILVCALLIFLILMQRSRNDGIGSAIASGMTQKYIGVQTNNVLVKGTVYLTITFFLLSLLLDHLYTERARAQADQVSGLHSALIKPLPTPTPVPTPVLSPTAGPKVSPVAVPLVSGKPIPTVTPVATPTPVASPAPTKVAAPPVPLPQH